jgi:putative ABC transport system permease protein
MLYRLVARYLTKHPVRSFLTVGSMVVAIFLLCMLRSLIVALEAGVKGARTNRLWVQSAVSLFVDLPLSYQSKIAAVEGVENTCKWQWFGGIYQDPSNFFAQFAVDNAAMLDIYPEIDVVSGDARDFLERRTGCLIGQGLADKFGWRIGDRIPLIGGIFPHPGGNDVPWEFEVVGIYVPRSSSIDNRTLFFSFEYFRETLEQGGEGFTPGMGTVVLRTDPDAYQQGVMAAIEELFEHGPQRVQATTEAEFQAQFVSMLGSVPFFINSIGGGVLIAILLACVNTMLMAFREEIHDIGVLKALGFTDGAMFALLLLQALTLCLLGGLLGIGLALGTQRLVVSLLGTMFPGYAVTRETVLVGLAVSAGIGLMAGLLPAWNARRLEAVEALRGL